ncbi:MAG: putative ORFan [Harvfovirus sp.]|uniref:Putative ORFan n=1 Tax=Harvfovirus sp. TaxID=2487768 RepID=A0A3G4ZZV4_9VIRU|nr:MAG: putative ORFan [Harvfovirus sp.]
MIAYQVVTRSQYTFFASEKQIACLLTLNVKTNDNPHEVNIVGISIIKISKNKNLVKVVVGTDNPNNSAAGGAGDPADPDPLRTNSLQNEQFRKNMKQYGIKYSKEKVLQILNVEASTGTPGIYRIFISALVCCGIDIDAFYLGEDALDIPLVRCKCADRTFEYKANVVSAFIQVPRKQISQAVAILKNINTAVPFDESQLCINADNVGCS